MGDIKYCEHCNQTKKNVLIYKMFFQNIEEDILNDFFSGYIGGIQDDYWSENNLCPFCKNEVKDINVCLNDILILAKASNYNRQLLDAMIELHDKDIIEYELKMSQFRAQVDTQEERKRQERNLPRCPKCGSTSITASQRGYSFWTGFLGSNKTVNRCSNCGHTWKP